jgi:hypothetical protein
MCLQPLHCGIQVGHLERETDLPANLAADLKLVDRLGLLLVENFEGSLAHIKDERSTLIFRPNLGGLEPKPVAIEAHQSVKGLGCECDSQRHNRRIRAWC